MLIMLFILFVLCLLLVLVEIVLVRKNIPTKERIMKQVPLWVLIMSVIAGLAHMMF